MGARYLMKIVRHFFSWLFEKHPPEPRPDNPEHAPDLQLGLKFYQAGKLVDADAVFQKILLARPDHFEALHHLGVIAQQSGNSLRAATLIRRAVEINPSSSPACNNLGVAYKSLGHLEDAEDCFRKALELAPDFAEAWNNLGNLHLDRGDLKQAETCFRQSLASKPDCVEALNNLANILREFSRMDEAENHCRKALALRPADPAIRLNLSFLVLSRGECHEGFALYDSRLEGRQKGTAGASPIYEQMKKIPVWRGEKLAGKRLLIWSEQGVGDSLMFASMFSDAINMKGHCIILCDERLLALLDRSFPAATVLASSTNLTKIRADFQIAAGSLARYFRTCLEDFPSHAGYLKAAQESVSKWHNWLAGLGKGLNVGIGWRSGMRSALRDMHYAELVEWEKILALPGVNFINLQYGDTEQELQEAETGLGVKIHRPPALDLKNDLDETAALIKSLDLVISAGTAVAAMAGALGKETWMYTLNSSWTRLGTEHMPWMPSVRIYDKNWDDDWSRILGTIADDLKNRRNI